MDLETLREVQSKERGSKGLTELSDSFYSDAANYIGELQSERDMLEDSYGEEAQQLNDALQSARQVAESIYERRVSKVVKLASLKANGVNVDEAGMTREERRMYENIVDEIQKNHEHVVGEVLGTTRDQQEEKRDHKDIQAVEEETEEATPSIEGASVREGYTAVRVMEDLPEFVGVDGEEYLLKEEDVAVIPTENAEALCEKDAAVKVHRNE